MRSCAGILPVLGALLALTSGAAASEVCFRIGYVTAEEAALAISAPPGSALRVRATPRDAPGEALERAITIPADGAPVTVTLAPLAPATPHAIAISPLAGGATQTGSFVTDTPPPPPGEAPDFAVLVTGGLPASPLATDLEMAGAALLAQDRNDIVIWLGGLSQPRLDDRLTPAGTRRAAARSLREPALAPLWNHKAHFGVLGEIDYGPPRAGRAWSNRGAALAAFAETWPTPHRPFSETPGVYQFRRGDAEFFVLDGWSWREGAEVERASREVLGDAQRRWLTQALHTSTARFKCVLAGFPLLSPSGGETALAASPAARKAFDRLLADPALEGVLLLSGGHPVGELTRIGRPDGYPLRELQVGPLTRSSRAAAAFPDLNYFRVPGTLVREPHFCRLAFSGQGDRRQLRLSAHALDGSELWAESLLASDLQAVR